MKKLSLLGIMFVLFWACNKDDEPSTKKSYFPLTVGNYWVYENFKVDKDSVETKETFTDSITIVCDTVIRDQTYFVIESYNNSMGNTEVYAVRDSSGYIVRSDGKVLFAENNFNDTLTTSTIEDGATNICTTIYKMEKIAKKITVPAGTFEVLNFKGTVNVTDTAAYEVAYPRYLNNYYAKNVGKILHSYFFLSTDGHFERRLVRYHIAD